MPTNLNEKGKAAELALNKWLNDNGLSFLYINQDRETFATLFQKGVKRPDFLILLESVGLIGVDVKHYGRNKNKYTLKLEHELKRVLAFERIFRISVWYAYYAEENGKTCWYWISALKAVEVGEVFTNSKTKEQFVAVDLSNFERIENNFDLGKLYTHRLPGLRKIKNF